jgi:hypothetical protein
MGFKAVNISQYFRCSSSVILCCCAEDMLAIQRSLPLSTVKSTLEKVVLGRLNKASIVLPVNQNLEIWPRNSFRKEKLRLLISSGLRGL